MKIIILILFISLLAVISVSAQQKKADKMLFKGIELKDYTKINDALSSGALPNDGLIYSVQQGDARLVTFFIEHGADPDKALKEAVATDNIELVQVLIDKGASFKHENILNLDDEIYFQTIKGGGLIPIFYISNQWKIKNADNTFTSAESLRNETSMYVYSLRNEIVGNRAIISAIDNGNLPMIQLLLNNGINAKETCAISYYSGLIDKINIIASSNYGPMPAFKLRPIEYAIAQNASSLIVELLQKYDDTRSYSFNFEKVSYIYENSSEQFLKVENSDIAINLTKKINDKKIYGARLLFSINNSEFKELKFIGFPNNVSKSKQDTCNSVTRYFYTLFGDSIQPKEIVFKVDIKSYGNFIDERNGEVYRTVVIGNQEIMAENFRFKTEKGCWLYNNDSKILNQYGYLYSEEALKSVVPTGWHVPSIKEWDELYDYCGSDYRSLIHALECGGGTGFDLELGGMRTMFGFSLLGYVAVFRCAEPNSNINFNFISPATLSLWTATSFHIFETNHAKCGFSVRLFKDK